MDHFRVFPLTWIHLLTSREVTEEAAPAAPSGGKMDVNTALQEVSV